MRLTAILLASVLTAAEVSGPIVGYAVQEDRREVRVILGVPGSTHYSDPIGWPSDATSVLTAPGHRWLLVLRGTEAAASAWIPETGAERSLAGEPSVVAFSPSGSAAVFYWRDEQRLLVYGGLPVSPSAMEMHGGEFVAFAVNDRGDRVAALTSAGELQLLTRDGGTLIREARPVVSFSFMGDDTTVAVAEADSDRIELIGPASRRVVQLPAAVSAKARFLPGGLADPENAVMYRFGLAGEVRAIPFEGIAVSGFESLRPRGSTLLKAPEGEVPRIVLGDELFYLPTLSLEDRAQ
jgi:hypothetical protein